MTDWAAAVAGRVCWECGDPLGNEDVEPAGPPGWRRHTICRVECSSCGADISEGGHWPDDDGHATRCFDCFERAAARAHA